MKSLRIRRSKCAILKTVLFSTDLTDHWDYIKEYVEAFRPVFICATKIQSTHVGLSDIYMMWLKSIQEVKKLKENRFSAKLCLELEKRLAVLKENMVCKVALLMDPRFNYIGSQFFGEDEKAEIRVGIIV